jgi:hypothetical protein
MPRPHPREFRRRACDDAVSPVLTSTRHLSNTCSCRRGDLNSPPLSGSERQQAAGNGIQRQLATGGDATCRSLPLAAISSHVPLVGTPSSNENHRDATSSHLPRLFTSQQNTCRATPQDRTCFRQRLLTRYLALIRPS